MAPVATTTEHHFDGSKKATMSRLFLYPCFRQTVNPLTSYIQHIVRQSIQQIGTIVLY